MRSFGIRIFPIDAFSGIIEYIYKVGTTKATFAQSGERGIAEYNPPVPVTGPVNTRPWVSNTALPTKLSKSAHPNSPTKGA